MNRRLSRRDILEALRALNPSTGYVVYGQPPRRREAPVVEVAHDAVDYILDLELVIGRLMAFYPRPTRGLSTQAFIDAMLREIEEEHRDLRSPEQRMIDRQRDAALSAREQLIRSQQPHPEQLLEAGEDIKRPVPKDELQTFLREVSNALAGNPKPEAPLPPPLRVDVPGASVLQLQDSTTTKGNSA